MINVLIPMSGRGQRFKEANYELPKPLIPIFNVPLIEIVVRNLGYLDGDKRFIFLVLKDHYEQYNLERKLKDITNLYESHIIVIDEITDGAARTALKAKELINNEDELLIANSDQWIDWNSEDFILQMRNKEADGGIVVFTATETKWSYAKVENDKVVEVAEKRPISDLATVGIYFYKNGKYFVDGAERMIEKDIRTNNEFYIAPVFNEMILDGKKIITYKINLMLGLGTPEDLENCLNNPPETFINSLK